MFQIAGRSNGPVHVKVDSRHAFGSDSFGTSEVTVVGLSVPCVGELFIQDHLDSVEGNEFKLIRIDVVCKIEEIVRVISDRNRKA